MGRRYVGMSSAGGLEPKGSDSGRLKWDHRENDWVDEETYEARRVRTPNSRAFLIGVAVAMAAFEAYLLITGQYSLAAILGPIYIAVAVHSFKRDWNA